MDFAHDQIQNSRASQIHTSQWEIHCEFGSCENEPVNLNWKVKGTVLQFGLFALGTIAYFHLCPETSWCAGKYTAICFVKLTKSYGYKLSSEHLAIKYYWEMGIDSHFVLVNYKFCCLARFCCTSIALQLCKENKYYTVSCAKVQKINTELGISVLLFLKSCCFSLF